MGTMMIGVQELQGVRVAGFDVQVKALTDTWGAISPALVIRDASTPREKSSRASRAFQHSVAALVEKLSEKGQWVVQLEDRHAWYQIRLELFEGTPTEVKEATAVLRRTLKACTEELS